MKRLFYVLLVAGLVLITASCNECSVIEDNGNPARKFRLLDEAGNDLWFGSNAIYDPNAVVFEHQSDGVLPITVNINSASVSVVIPMTNGKEEVISMKMDSTRSDKLTYAGILFEEKCKRNYELSYMFQDGTKICTLCGTTQFENDGFIYLKE